MTRIANISRPHPTLAKMLDNERAPEPHSIVLTISGAPGNYQGKFDRNLIITTQEETKFIINLRNETQPEARISILDYASTGISKHWQPIHGFDIKPDGQSAEFTLSMLSNQMLDFGFSILIEAQTSSGMLLQYLFCDPQASNDPKLSG